MPTRIELLKQAGFSDDEIGDWASTERSRMRGEGFTDSEIDDEFGVTRPPSEVPPAFVERLKQGNWLHRILGTAGEYAQRYFGDEPLGFSPENKEALSKLGIVGDVIIPAAKPVDALLRAIPAGIAGIGAGLGQTFEEGHDAALGPGPYAKGKAARDFAQLAQIAALLAGAKGPNAGSARTPVASVENGPVIALPRAEDFRNAAASISGTAASFPTEQKLLRLWTEHGIHPNEVANDALRDRTLAETIGSDSDKLPEFYVRDGRASAANGPQTKAPAQVHVGALDESRPPIEPRGQPSGIHPIEIEREANSAAIAPTDEEDRSYSNSNTANSAPLVANSEATQMYDPPQKKQRTFIEDYPQKPQGRRLLLTDIEGRPLTAKFIAGRRTLGGADEALSPADIKAAIRRLGLRFGEVPAKAVKGTNGQFFGLAMGSKKPEGYIFVNSDLPSSDRNMVAAHEFGHAIDLFAKQLSDKLTKKEIDELRVVYGNLRSGSEELPYFHQPEAYQYEPQEVNLELFAEGLRAYMTNPNYFKTVAPKTAAKIRAAVNVNPHLKRVIQFNSLAAAGLAGAATHNQSEGDR